MTTVSSQDDGIFNLCQSLAKTLMSSKKNAHGISSGIEKALDYN